MRYLQQHQPQVPPLQGCQGRQLEPEDAAPLPPVLALAHRHLVVVARRRPPYVAVNEKPRLAVVTELVPGLATRGRCRLLEVDTARVTEGAWTLARLVKEPEPGPADELLAETDVDTYELALGRL